MDTAFEVWEFLIWLATFGFFAGLLGYALLGAVPEERIPRPSATGAMRMEGETGKAPGPAEEGHPVEEPYRRAA